MEANHAATNTHVKVTPSTAATPNPLMQTAQQISQGQIPHNNQLQQTIQATQVALEEAKYESPLSAKGQVLVEDAKDLLASASRMIQEKNSDEKFQRLVGTGAHAGSATRSNLSGTDVNVGRGDASVLGGHARSIFNNGRSIGMFAVRSGQFRELLLELLDLFQSILKNTTDSVAAHPNSQPMTSIASDIANQPQGTIVSQAQKDQIWNKFTVLLNQLASRPEYYTAVDHLFQIVDHMNQKGRMVKNQTGGTDALPTDEYDNFWQELKIVMEEFCGVGTMDEFERRNWVLFNAMKEDPEARMWAQNFRMFLMEAIKNPTMLNDNSRSQYGRNLMDQGRYLFQGKYRPYFSDVFDQFRLILTNIKNDSATSDFAAKMQKFGADFAFDASGKPDLFVIQESLSQMRSILVPVMSRQLSNLPIPKVQGSNPKYDFAIEGLLLHVGDLLPEFVNFRTKSDTRMSVQRLASQKSSVKIVMEVDRIRALFKDIKFMYRRKKMPRIEDHGIADVDLSQGSGLSLRIVWKLKSSPNQPFLMKLLKVKCNIDRLAITVRSAKHSVLDKLVTKLFAGTIKKQIANAIVNNIINALNPMSARLNELFKRRPMTGLATRANDQLKNTVFSGEPGVLSKAKDAITTGAQQVKAAVQGNTSGSTPMMTSTPMMSTPMMGSETLLVETIPVVSTSSTGLESGLSGMTFVERENVGRKDWNFEWYNPSSYDTVESVDVIPSSLESTKMMEQGRTTEQPFVSI